MRRAKRYWMVVTCLVSHRIVQAQEATDTLSLLQAVQKGQVQGHARLFAMGTDNVSGLSDYWAGAIGSGLQYKTAAFHGFQLQLGGAFSYDLASVDLARADVTTGQYNRYEKGLFDLTQMSSHPYAARLEYLNLQYRHRSLSVTLGKQRINTPLINPQDSRMLETLVNGVWVQHHTGRWKWAGGYLYGIAPRSTGHWYRVSQSVGLYGQGHTPSGAAAMYAGHLHSKGILMAGETWQSANGWKIQGWQLAATNLFYTFFLETGWQHAVREQEQVEWAVQLIQQGALGDGGNADTALTYYMPGTHATSIGAKAGWKNAHWSATVNINRITSAGRFLMPREWGTEPFYTHLSRERNEGLGDVEAIMVQGGYHPQARWDVSLAYGFYKLPPIDQYRLNKYGLSSYHHIKAATHYRFARKLEGFSLTGLYVYKAGAGTRPANLKYVINKIDLSNFNLLINYQF